MDCFVVLVQKRVGEALCLWSCVVLVLVLLQRASAQAGATSRPTRVGLARARYFLNFLPSSFLTTLTLPVCRLRCSRPQLSPHTAKMESSRIFVRGLPPKFTEDDVRKHFSKFPVTDVKFFPHRRIGYVGYKTPEDATKAVKYFNKTFIRMTRINVEIARPVSIMFCSSSLRHSCRQG